MPILLPDRYTRYFGAWLPSSPWRTYEWSTINRPFSRPLCDNNCANRTPNRDLNLLVAHHPDSTRHRHTIHLHLLVGLPGNPISTNRHGRVVWRRTSVPRTDDWHLVRIITTTCIKTVFVQTVIHGYVRVIRQEQSTSQVRWCETTRCGINTSHRIRWPCPSRLYIFLSCSLFGTPPSSLYWPSILKDRDTLSYHPYSLSIPSSYRLG